MKLFYQKLLLFAAFIICSSGFGMRQAAGQYTGTGGATRVVTGLGFQPEVILVKPASTNAAFITTSTMASGKTKVLDPANILQSNYITTIGADGFTAGTSANTLGRIYYFVAFDDDADIDVGTFTGSTSSQSVNVGYRPAMVWVLGEAGDWNDYGNISQDGWDSSPDAFNNGSILDASSASIGAYDASGFSVPASATSGVDDGAVYHYVTFKNSNVYTGTYSGTGSAQSVNITVNPDFVIVKNTSDLTNNVWFKTYAMPATASYKFVDDVSTIAIDGFSTTGFSLGVQGEVNGNGSTLQYFAIGTATGTLPVEIVSFTGDKKENTIALTWQTASEINSNYFTVERSSDGVHFEVVGIVDAAGNSNSLLHYFFVDENPMDGNNYYRLKESDNDGQATYFKTVVVNFSDGNHMVVSIYPNPSTDEATLILSENKNQQIIISDAAGKTIQEMNSTSSTLKINTSNLAEGIYYINGFNAQGVSFSEKLVVVK
jgi:hypothetical protein